MKEIEYWKNNEYAMKAVIPFNKYWDEWEVFDRIAWKFLDITDWSKQQILDLDSEVVWQGHIITEEEYNEIINNEKKD